MKKLNIFNLVLLLVLSSCSEDSNTLTGPDTGGMQCQTPRTEILYTVEEFGITAHGDSIVTDQLIYADTSNADYIFVDFIGITNADSSGYLPTLKITKDMDSVLTQTTSIDINGFHSLQIDFKNHKNLTFYLELQCGGQACDSARLYINNLQIYRYY